MLASLEGMILRCDGLYLISYMFIPMLGGYPDHQVGTDGFGYMECTYVPKPCPNFRIEQEPKLGLQPNFGTRGGIYPSVHLVFFIGSRVQFLSEVGTKTGSKFFLNLVSVPTG
jgi:hypothetical protein